jgi:heterodisulfide reductase subunit A-like polyferredoxin
VDMPMDGVYVCGAAHSPKLISESIAQAMAAASRAVTFLSQPEITLSVVTATVDQERCASCLICARVCPYKVPRMNKDGVSEIDDALCRGCGICAAECPAKAIQLNWYEDDQVMSKVDALLEGVL